MNRIKWISLSLLLLLGACSKSDKIIQPENTGTKPGILSNISVENTPGGAKITYLLPNNEDMLYVQAIFSSRNGEERTTKASLYTNFVELEGFADTKEYNVTLYAVNRSENRSEPVNVKIHPLPPPIETVFNSLVVKEDFGGINMNFLNEGEDEFVFSTQIMGPVGKLVTYDKLYTKAKTRDYSVRGLAAEPTEFFISVKDKWGNLSDTLKTTLTPIYEEMVSKTNPKWVAMNYPNDSQIPKTSPQPIEKIWDGVWTTNTSFFIGKEPPQNPLPNWFTINMGKQYQLSRMKMYQYTLTNYAYTLGNPEVFEIWGSNNPTPDGAWDNWELLMTCTSIKPSGSLGSAKTAEDVAYAAAGEDFAFPYGTPPVQYIRFKTNRTWGRADNLLLAELTFWGGK